MSGNATYRLTNTAVLSVCAVEAPIVVTSAQFDERLADTYRAGRACGRDAGEARRRRASAAGGPTDVSFADAAAMAGAKALAEAGIDPSQIGLMINTSVSPRLPRAVDGRRRAPPARPADAAASTSTWPTPASASSTRIQLAGTMIDAGQADYALLVDGEGSALHPGGHAGPARGGPTRPPTTCARSSPR